MMWASLAVGVACLIYALIVRQSRQWTDEENGELRISLGTAHETIERLRHTIAALGAADPTLDDLAGMHDDDDSSA